MAWHSEMQIASRQFQCGFCGNKVATDKGFFNKDGKYIVYLCPHCQKPTFFDERANQTPGIAPGKDVGHLPPELEAIYNEARRCVSVCAYTAAVLACRKLLMHVAVQQKAEAGKTFIHYVEFLADNGYVPPNGKGWVDHIRKKGNEATHEIVLMKIEDAVELISFSEMLLKFIYEFPASVPIIQN
ncbi:MAG TPA: DUF4145 domain-containing protein [Methylotenera sp.]|nr:DUF4145 domain-containing protein [Methylotenera sp.]HPV45615.1 DUF4145 domain-containing protein [Methylotenera sp.]